MTKEQAAEIVLAGPQWGTCRHCDDGLAESVPVYLEGTSRLLGGPSKETVMVRIRCRVCHGKGVLLKKNWYAARKLLGLPWEAVYLSKGRARVVIKPRMLEAIICVTIPKKYSEQFDREHSLIDPNPCRVSWCLYEDVDKHL